MCSAHAGPTRLPIGVAASMSTGGRMDSAEHQCGPDGHVLKRFAALTCVLGLALLAASPVSAAPPPNPDFSVMPSTPEVGQVVTFTASNLKPSSTVQWDFENDGVFDATGTSVQHAYDTAGSKTIVMRATPTGDPPETVTKSILVTAPSIPPASNQPPTAAFIATPNPALVGQTVNFDASGSSDDGAIASYEWDLDGDGFYETTTATASKVYSSAGLVAVKLRVTDQGGSFDTHTVFVDVGLPVVGAGQASTAPLIGASQTSTTPLVVESQPLPPPPVGASQSSTPPPRLLSPFPVIRVLGLFTRRGTRITLLAVRGPRGVKVTFRCRGRGCSFQRTTRVAATGRVRLRLRFRRTLRPGARITISVTKPGKIGKYTSLTIRRGLWPRRRDLCLAPGSSRPVPCPPA